MIISLSFHQITIYNNYVLNLCRRKLIKVIYNNINLIVVQLEPDKILICQTNIMCYNI